MKTASSRRVLAAAVALASTATFASAQTARQNVFQKAESFNLSTLFTAGTGYGTNPLSVTVDGAGNAYVGGYNSSATTANVGIVKLSNVLSGTPSVDGLASTQFAASASRGIDALASVGGDIVRLHDSGTAATSFIDRLTPTGGSVWQTLNPGNGVRVWALGIDPKADVSGATPAPEIGFLGQGQGRRASLRLDGTVDYTFGGGAKPGAVVNTSPALPNQGNPRSLAFDSAGNVAVGSETGFGVGARVNENRFSTLDGSQLDVISRVVLKSVGVNNVGSGITFIEGAATDELIAFTARATTSGNGADVQLTNGQGGVSTVNSKFVQVRQTRGQPGYLTQTQLTGAEDGLGTQYTGEVKNFATGVDANGNPALYVIDYLNKQLDVYTIEPRYSVDADSTWSAPTAWTLGIVPDSRTTNATFGNTITAARTVTLDGNKTVKQLKFDSTNAYTINGTSTINLSAPANDNLNAYISVLNGSHNVNVPIVLGTNARFDVNNAADTLTVNTVSGNGKVLAKRGPGALSAGSVRVNTLALENGTVTLRPNATEAGLSRVGAITLGTTGTTPTTGTLNLTNNGLIVDYPAAAANPYADLQAALAAGTITSSLIDADHVIGIVDYSLTAPPTFTDPALAIDATSVLVRYTLKGDANLDQKVNFSDLVTLAQNYNKQSGALYQQGDSNADGAVNFADLVALAQHYNQSVPPSSITAAFGASFAADWALAQSLVPEPTTMLIAGAALPMMTRRRR